MDRFVIHEETLHYAAAFLERWEEKAPNKQHEKMKNEMRKLSNYLLEHLYHPLEVNVIRHKLDK